MGVVVVVLPWKAHDIHKASLLPGGGSRLFQGHILLVHLDLAFHIKYDQLVNNLYDQLNILCD